MIQERQQATIIFHEYIIYHHHANTTVQNCVTIMIITVEVEGHTTNDPQQLKQMYHVKENFLYCNSDENTLLNIA